MRHLLLNHRLVGHTGRRAGWERSWRRGPSARPWSACGVLRLGLLPFLYLMGNHLQVQVGTVSRDAEVGTVSRHATVAQHE